MSFENPKQVSQPEIPGHDDADLDLAGSPDQATIDALREAKEAEEKAKKEAALKAEEEIYLQYVKNFEKRSKAAVEVKEQTPEALRDERRSEIIKELEKEWEDKNGPMFFTLSKEEIERNKERAKAWVERGGKNDWPILTRRMTEAANEFYFDHRGMGENSVPSRAEKILIERFPEYATKQSEEQPAEKEKISSAVTEAVVGAEPAAPRLPREPQDDAGAAEKPFKEKEAPVGIPIAEESVKEKTEAPVQKKPVESGKPKTEPSSEKHPRTKEQREFLRELKKTRADVANAQAQLDGWVGKVAIKAGLNLTSAFLGKWTPDRVKAWSKKYNTPARKDILSQKGKSEKKLEELEAKYAKEKAYRAILAQKRKVNELIEARKEVPKLGEIMHKGWEKLGKKKIFDHVNARVAVSYGLLGAGLAVGTTVPPLAAGLFFGRRIFSGLSSGIGSHQLMEIGSMKLAERNMKSLEKDRKKIESKIKEVLEENTALKSEYAKAGSENKVSDKLRKSLEKSNQETLALRHDYEEKLLDQMRGMEIMALRKGEQLEMVRTEVKKDENGKDVLDEKGNPVLIWEDTDYAKLSWQLGVLRAENWKDSYQFFMQKQRQDFEKAWADFQNKESWRSAYAVGIGAFVGSGEMAHLAHRIGGELFHHAPNAGVPQHPGAGASHGTERIMISPDQHQPAAPSGHEAAPLEQPGHTVPAKPEAPGSIHQYTQEWASQNTETIHQGGSMWASADKIAEKQHWTSAHLEEARRNTDWVSLTHDRDQVMVVHGPNGDKFSFINHSGISSGTLPEHLVHAAPGIHEVGTNLPDTGLEHPSGLAYNVVQPESGEAPDYLEQIKSLRHEAAVGAPYPFQPWNKLDTGPFMDFQHYILKAVDHWHGKEIFGPNLSPEQVKENSPVVGRLIEWFRQKGDTVAVNWINQNRVAIIVADKPGPMSEIRLVSTLSQTPWDQGRLIPKDILNINIPWQNLFRGQY